MGSNVDISARIFVGKRGYILPPELPTDPEARAVCQEHLDQGVYADLIRNFEYITSDRDATPITRLSCQGVCSLGRCGLSLDQLDPSGAIIASRKLSPQ
jgi:hypothetical protein